MEPQKSNIAKVNKQERSRDSKRVLTALSGKQKEPNRGQGSDRKPSTPQAHTTGPVREALNRQLVESQSTRKALCEDVENNKPTIFLMRHGRTALDTIHRSDGWLDFPLSDEGRVGTIRAQRYLQDVSLKTVYAAPLKRTIETAEIMSSGCLHKPGIVIAKELMTWNMGKLTGAPKQANKSVVKYFIDHPNEVAAGGESLNAFHDRFLGWLEERKGEVQEGESPILIILSGSNLR